MANTSFGLGVLSPNILDFDKIRYSGRSGILMAVTKKVKVSLAVTSGSVAEIHRRF
jgi:hypothetical protein